MYHVAETGIIVIILYIISYFFYRNGFISVLVHRKIWNLILAITFIITASAGLFLALQITYKWEITLVETILEWHVPTGIIMTITGLFHLTWHLRYFTPASMKTGSDELNVPITASDTKTNASLFIIGFISSSVQLLLMKEVINITGGYELITGTFLFAWLLGSAAGSKLASRSPLSDPGKINLLFCTGPLVSILLLVVMSGLFLNTGETPSFLSGVVFCFIVLLPFSFLSGFSFIKMLYAGIKNGRIPGSSFAIETTGGIAAGIAISILSKGFLNTYQSLLIITLLGIVFSILTFYFNDNRKKMLLKASAMIVATLLILLSPDLVFRQLLLRGSVITKTFDTPYGNITAGVNGKETNIYYNQRLIIYEGDAVESEEDIHYAMLQTHNPQKVLLISGGTKSRLRELNKYDLVKTVFVERDPALSQIGSEGIDHAGVEIIQNIDALRFIRNTNETFDAVILLIPPPSSLSLNRYYTREFFGLVREKMDEGAVLSCSPGINPYYFNEEAVRHFSSVYNSLKSIFRNVLIISGNKIYFIASDNELSSEVCRLAAEKGIQNSYVGPDYMSDDLIRSKSDEILSVIDNDVPVNKYFRPIASFYYQGFNFSMNTSAKTISAILLLLAFAISLISIRRSGGMMYFSSLALAAFEITLLCILQITIGNMYQITGLVLAGMMTGLAIGSGTESAFLNRKKVWFKPLLLILIYIFSSLTLKGLNSIDSKLLIVTAIILYGAIPAWITGSIFRDLTRGAENSQISSVIYSADLAGAATGFLIFSGLTIPVAGLQLSLYLLPLLILAGFLTLLLRK